MKRTTKTSPVAVLFFLSLFTLQVRRFSSLPSQRAHFEFMDCFLGEKEKKSLLSMKRGLGAFLSSLEDHLRWMQAWLGSLRFCLPHSSELGVLELFLIPFVAVVQLLCHVQLFVTPWTIAHQASLSITNSQSLLKFMFIELVMPSNHLIGHVISCTHSNLPQWTFAFCMLRKLRLYSNLMFSTSSLKFGEFFKFLAIFGFWDSSPPMMSTLLSQPLSPKSHLQSYP